MMSNMKNAERLLKNLRKFEHDLNEVTSLPELDFQQKRLKKVLDDAEILIHGHGTGK